MYSSSWTKIVFSWKQENRWIWSVHFRRDFHVARPGLVFSRPEKSQKAGDWFRILCPLSIQLPSDLYVVSVGTVCVEVTVQCTQKWMRVFWLWDESNYCKIRPERVYLPKFRANSVCRTKAVGLPRGNHVGANWRKYVGVHNNNNNRSHRFGKTNHKNIPQK